ncbi:hypothetical protein N7495_007730 [Penicillium taxi]|uniref:uncharacterized protein n=1 Tax=Penicillium taxi TaxID=168475 RepID=UPI0025459100|nr:uncharacterized protein N7495_007730 [Penicillium taxi]KAJ5887689.1 hypothetical protein N7495_007730 [Penicillium taxi]
MPRPQPVYSRLESLPVEILQLIFLYSLEINLPRASLYLGRVLSNELVYSWLIRLVFSSANPGSRDGFFTSDFLPPQLDFWALSKEQRQLLQTTLLSCQWCTLSLMQKCQREYIEHTIRRKTAGLIIRQEDQDKLSNLGPYFEKSLIERYDRSEEGNNRGKGDLVISAQLAESPSSRVFFKIAIWFQSGAVHIRTAQDFLSISSFADHNDLFRLPCSPAHTPARIPDKLLRSPWSETQLDFLQLLSSGGFYLDEDEYSRDRSAEITTRLIRKHRVEPLHRLLGMYIRSANCRVPIRWPLQLSDYNLACRYGQGAGDPMVLLMLSERWYEMSFSTKQNLIRHVEMSEEDILPLIWSNGVV